MVISRLASVIPSFFKGGSRPKLVARIDRWDAGEISGEVTQGTANRLIIELSGKSLASIDGSTDLIAFNDNRFRINTQFFPAACLNDIRVILQGDDEAEAVLSPPGDRQPSKRAHSLYGGMWIDAPDWEETLARKRANGEIDEEVAERIITFVRDGYVVIPSAVAKETVDRLNQEIEDAWDGKMDGVRIEVFNPQALIPIERKYYDQNHKLLDAYYHMRSAREAAAAPKVVEFMRAVFEDTPKAFQQLSFVWGSRQPIHKDTAYVKVDGNPMSMLATWTALEDISEGTGELEYYVGSHRSDDFIFGGFSKWMEAAPAEHQVFLDALHADSARLGQPRSTFLAKAGDVLVWHADLAHGGSQITRPGVTRKSIVTHFTASKYNPFYHRASTTPPFEMNGVAFVCELGPVKE